MQIEFRNRNKQFEEVREKLMAIGIIWVTATAGIVIMKKIEPNNRAYPVYAVIVALLFTLSTFLS